MVPYYFALCIFVTFVSYVLSRTGTEICTFDFAEPLVDYVLENGNVMHPPQPFPVEVEVEFELNSVHDVDDKKGTVAVDFAIEGEWIDGRFTDINCTLESPFELPFEERNELWSPKFSIVNANGLSIQQRRGDVEHVGFKSFLDQKLSFSRVYSTNIPCRFDYRRFPFDVVVCEIQLRPTGSSRGNVVVTWEGSKASKSGFCKDLDDHAHHLSHFTLKHIDIEIKPTKHSSSEDLWVKIYFQRHYDWHLTHIFMQTGLIVLIPWIAFFFSLDVIPPRMTMNMSSMVALMIKYNAVMNYLPPVSYFTGLDVWLTACALFIFAAVACHTYVVNVHKTTKQSIKIRPWITADGLDLFFGIVYFTVFMSFVAIYTIAMMSGKKHAAAH